MILAIAFFDSVIPVVPSETAVIIGGVAAGQGDQSLPLVILCGAAGAFLGDNAAYLIGRLLQPGDQSTGRSTTEDEATAGLGPRPDPHPRWPAADHGPVHPGRAVGADGDVWYHPAGPRWFARWIALAAVIWATYAAGLGYIFGNRFKDNHTAAFLLAFGAALGITLLIELVRHVRKGKGPAEIAATEFRAEAIETVEEAIDHKLHHGVDEPAGNSARE